MRLPRPDKSGLAMIEKDERYKGIMGLPHFILKFAMAEGWNKIRKEIQRMDSRFRGNDKKGNRNGKKVMEVTLIIKFTGK